MPRKTTTSPRKRVSVLLPARVYNEIEEAAERQGLTLAEYGRLAMCWYFGISEAQAAARRSSSRAGYRRKRLRNP